jgi:XRE family transcriptional regulator, regulator of sulfur utilization
MLAMINARAKMRRLRLERGWSYERLARETNMTTSAVWRIEHGKADPTVASLEKIAAAFGMTASELLAGDDEEPTEVAADTA